MNHWLKRVSLVLPPVIVAGVYFNFIPVGQGLRNKIDSMMAKETTPSQKVFAIVKKVKGEVFIKDHPTFPAVMVKGGEILKSGQSITVGKDSSLLLSYTSSDSWLIRISADSQVNIDELMKMKNGEETVFNLVSGALTLKIKNNSGSVRNMIIRTKFASFTTRGGTIAVLTDGVNRSLMTVQEGIVEAENFKLMEKTSVREGNTYVVNREGEKKAEIDLDAIDFYPWELNDLDRELPTMEKVLGSVGDLGPTPDDLEKKKISKLKEIDDAIIEFKKKNEELKREFEILSENAVQSRAGYRAEKLNIEKDMRCLETSEFECNLFSEKILITKGFPRTWGNPRYRSSLVVGLGKYLQERNEEVTGREEEAKILSELMARREMVLKAVEADRAKGSDIDKLIPALHEDRLKR